MSYRRVSVANYGSAVMTTQEAKDHLRVDFDDEDTLIDAYLEAATRHVESASGVALRSQTWTLTLDGFDRRCISLPGGRVGAVNSVKYYDLEETQQTLSSSEYTVTLGMVPAVVEAPNGWPGTQVRVGAVEIEYTVGGVVPAGLLQAVRLILSHWYENREASAERMAKLPFGVDELINANAAGWYG